MMLLRAEQVSMNYGTRQLFTDVTIHLNAGDRIGIIGINGTGKSSLLRVMAGAAEPDSGTVTLDPNIQVSYLSQDPHMEPEHTVMEQVFAAWPAEFRELAEYEARSMLTRLGITDFEQKVGTLSGGQKKRVALAAALIHPADVLILDEPTNHLDADMVAWLEERLKKFRGGLIMVTHDRYFLERVVTEIAELSHAKLRFYEANYSKYLELKDQEAQMQEASERKRQALLRREREWIMRGCRARTTKSKDRVERYHALVNQTQEAADGTVQVAAQASRLGKQIIALDHVSKSYDGKVAIADFSLSISREDRLGIVGHNGAGKSTLLNMIAGRLAPDSGTVEIGQTVKIGYFTQEGRDLDPNQRVFDCISEIGSQVTTSEGTLSASQMLERFLFPPEVQYRQIGKLSGGERRRLYLLSILMQAPNVLLLDEPTNDLDITTLSILEDYLETFPGPVLAVSHDRYFLDRLAGEILEVSEGGAVTRHVGNYSDYAASRPEPEAPEKKAVEKKEPPKPRPKKLKFSFKEQREYDTIDADIAALEEKIAACDREIAENASDYLALERLSEEKSQLEAQLDEKTERWVYLTELAEQIEAQRQEGNR
ncbi:MAG TPA: ABC-F family ATP-binding cassette domain-containing protein [Candidatus Avoscillospira avistercoris]|uniref:ABC-F family ATP-binding cassette domain-containing protein n=1 Tax=Candidatus Avoscillospira avistercoris TaxID=2840707 RepID=A0A9D1JSW3_9FIRM|nr:ABC-F family ATP-binding cassette domain-containing protein [Candidatus Avoscillospira avistercoris]